MPFNIQHSAKFLIFIHMQKMRRIKLKLRVWFGLLRTIKSKNYDPTANLLTYLLLFALMEILNLSRKLTFLA